MLIYTISNSYALPVAIFDFSVILVSDSTIIRPGMLFEANKYAYKVKFHIFHLHYQVKVLPVSRLQFLFPVERGSNCAQGDVATSSGDFGILKKKLSNFGFAPIGDFQWSSS